MRTLNLLIYFTWTSNQRESQSKCRALIKRSFNQVVTLRPREAAGEPTSSLTQKSTHKSKIQTIWHKEGQPLCSLISSRNLHGGANRWATVGLRPRILRASNMPQAAASFVLEGIQKFLLLQECSRTLTCLCPYEELFSKTNEWAHKNSLVIPSLHFLNTSWYPSLAADLIYLSCCSFKNRVENLLKPAVSHIWDSCCCTFLLDDVVALLPSSWSFGCLQPPCCATFMLLMVVQSSRRLKGLKGRHKRLSSGRLFPKQ